MTTVTANVFKGKWGFHPCSHQTYLKLKLIHKVYWMSIFRLASWNRWNRKDVQNRVQRWHRVDGRKEKLFPPVPMPEPDVTPFVVKGVGFNLARLNPIFQHVVSDFQKARTPMMEDQVQFLAMTPEKIDELYVKCKEWLG